MRDERYGYVQTRDSDSGSVLLPEQEREGTSIAQSTLQTSLTYKTTSISAGSCWTSSGIPIAVEKSHPRGLTSFSREYFGRQLLCHGSQRSLHSLTTERHPKCSPPIKNFLQYSPRFSSSLWQSWRPQLVFRRQNEGYRHH